jgi:hypothetical protein
MAKELVLHYQASKHLAQYKQMSRAIATCHGIDECKHIIDKSVAMAAYYAQIKDRETELMFHRVRLRAWRRIGELFSVVSLKRCPTWSAKINTIRDAFQNDPSVADMSDARIADILRLMAISDEEFEAAVNEQVNGSIAQLMRLTPQALKEAERARKENEAQMRRYMKRKEKEDEEKAVLTTMERKVAVMKRKHEDELDKAAEAAMEDVGITLERKDRANMKQVVFLIKNEVHELMRQAAFDKRITMQDMLRRGLRLWLDANGYDWPDGNANDGTRGYRDREARL